MRSALFLTMLLSCVLALLVIASEPEYLHQWDEQYHALVAKNLADQPLRPMLYKQPLLPTSPAAWTENHVWLEKGPVPLWGVSISYRIFGFSPTSGRIPSAVYALLLVLVVFLYGKMTVGESAGRWAAFFAGFSGIAVWIASGGLSSDHVEMAFTFWISAGWLAVIFWHNKPAPARAFLIGLLTGIAFLCKWYPALLVPVVWAFRYWLLKEDRKKSIPDFLSNGLAMVGGLMLTAGLWVAFVFWEFPEEAAHVFFKFLNAYGETVEQHTGPWYYYLVKITAMFGEWIWLPLLLIVVDFKKGRMHKLLPEVLSVFAVVCLFSFAETKRMTYLMPVALPLFVINGWFAQQLWAKRVISLWWMLPVVVMVGLTVRFSLERAKPMKSPRSDNEMLAKFDAEARTVFRDDLPAGAVVFNHPEPVKLMFYRGVTAYGRMPMPEDLAAAQSQNRPCLVMP